MDWTKLLVNLGTAVLGSAVATFGTAYQQGATPKQAGSAAGVAALGALITLLKQSPLK